MASGIARDFNNLLAPILGFSELLLNMPAESRDNDKLESFLKKIQVAAQDGAAVVSRLREFYRAHNEDDEAYSVINPEILIGQVKDLTEHRWKIQAEGRAANIRFETDIRTTRCIRGNESELRQSLANLVINAVDAIKNNGTITVSIEDLKDRVSIQVKDNGGGMPDMIQDKCLDAFYSTKGQLGTGLGLSIVCGIVKRHSGEIAIDSKEGEGTTITMSFPAVEADLPEEKLAPIPVELEPLHIMLVDDESILIEVISELLRSGGHTVQCFTDPKLAIEEFQSNSYDLVITVRAMPNMSGDQLAAEIKALKPETPVYLMTGFGDLIEGTRENPPNIDAVLGKPVPLDTLNRKLAELISSKTA
jgi:CheY-like chemotaxis protein